MVYRPDLGTDASGNAIYVGWLERGQSFNRGVVTQDFLKKLLLHYSQRVRQTRGFHVCHFCEERQFGIPIEIDGKTIRLGSAEIEIRDERGHVFVAPDLLYHYITVHQYLPPAEFVAAVCKTQ